MKCTRPVTLLVVLAASAWCPCASGALKVEKWKHLATVTVEKTPAEAKGLVEVSLSPEVLDTASPSLGDVRVTDDAGNEVPYVIERTRHPVVPPATVSARLINRTFLPGQSSTVTADFSRKFLKDCVRVETRGTDFRREVLVESSDDGTSWQRVREGALIFRVGGDGRSDFERDWVTFPENDQRYLRITVKNGADDKEPVEVTAVLAQAEAAGRMKPGRTASVDVGRTDVVQKHENHKTEITFDLGCRNLPLDRIELTFGDANFFRTAVLEGRDTETHVERNPREDGVMAEKTVETAWRPLRSVVLFCYSAGGSRDSSTGISLDGLGSRYLRLVIANGDNPPLDFRGAKVTRFLQLVRFPAGPARSWRLYFGNDRASAPSYDLPHYVQRLQSEGVVEASLWAVGPNPDYSDLPELPPWTERHPFILWAALIAIAAVLALLILRQVRALKTGSSSKA